MQNANCLRACTCWFCAHRAARWRRLAGLLMWAAVAACGGSPAAPSSPGSAGSGTISGIVVSVVEGLPIPGASVKVGNVTSTADADGRFAVAGIPAIGQFPFVIEAPGYFQRRTSVRLTYLASPPEVEVDLIPHSTPFDYNFFRQFARNELERGPTGLEPLRPWTVAPSFYIKTVLDPTGEPILSGVVEHVATVLVNGVREYSGGRLSAAQVEMGMEDRAAAPGWVNVLFRRELSGPNIAGQATLGGNQGTMLLRFDPDNPRLYVNDPSGCYARVVQVAAHEIQHTMGYYHTWISYDPLYEDPDCDAANLSESLRYHAGVMYSRPRGNLDPDTDPEDFAFSVTTGTKPVVSCSEAHVGVRTTIR